MKLTCLLPIRNGALELPEYLESALFFCDSIIALDDGSTDNTLEILQSCDKVEAVLTNPRRETYVGWNDRENRQKLLDAAAIFKPDWIIWIDADERLEKSDSEALRKFLECEAQLQTAYCLEVLRVIGDLQTYDRDGFWVPRLYSFEPNLLLPSEELHLDLMPVQFEIGARVRTSLRLLHKAGITNERRQERYNKYVESDPDRKWLPEDAYQRLLDPPRHTKSVEPRDPARSVVLGCVDDS
jgi:glycosyltransferase involved in cell wall biosynthesis